MTTYSEDVNNKWNQATAIPRKLIDDAFTRMK